MTEDDYFKIASANRIIQNKEEPKVKKRGRPKKEETAPTKPIYDISRNEQGKTDIQPRIQNETPKKTINEINQEIQNNSIDDKLRVKELMIQECYEALTRTQIEIDVLMEEYRLYNKEIYKKQADQYRNKHSDLINKIRILKSLYK